MSMYLKQEVRSGRHRARRAVAAVAMMLPLLAGHAMAQAPKPAPTPAEHLSWYGDPKAPNLSGVWVRAGSAASPSASKEGWLPWPPPLTAPFAAIWKARVANAAEGKRTDDPIRNCLPAGMPRFITGTNAPLLIMQTPGRVVLYHDGMPVRRVWLNPSALPRPEDIESYSNGNATGRYEGADLVTAIVGVKDQPVDSTGIPHSDDMTIVERFHRVDAKTLTVEVTLTDPLAYTAPLTTKVTYHPLNQPLWEPTEFLCNPVTNYYPDVYVH